MAVFHFSAVADQIEYATYEDLKSQGRHAIEPGDLPLFSDAQYKDPGFPYTPFCHDSPLGWIEGVELISGKQMLVPAQLVLIYYKPRPFEAQIGYPTTGGLAFHPDRRRAFLHGLYEFIERDAINLRWFCKIPPERVSIDLAEFLGTDSSFQRGRLYTTALDNIGVYLNTVDIPIPVLTTVAIDRFRDEGAFLGGGGSWSNRERALSQSLFELGRSRTALKHFRPIGMKNIKADSSLSEMTDFFDAAVYFGFRANMPAISLVYRRRGSEDLERCSHS